MRHTPECRRCSLVLPDVLCAPSRDPDTTATLSATPQTARQASSNPNSCDFPMASFQAETNGTQRHLPAGLRHSARCRHCRRALVWHEGQLAELRVRTLSTATSRLNHLVLRLNPPAPAARVTAGDPWAGEDPSPTSQVTKSARPFLRLPTRVCAQRDRNPLSSSAHQPCRQLPYPVEEDQTRWEHEHLVLEENLVQ